MKILIVFAHPEPKSMNGAMYNTAVDHFKSIGHSIKTTDLYRMQFNPVSNRSNFKNVHNSDFFKQQLEEIHATEVNGFAESIDIEQKKVEWCDLMIFQFPLWWFSVPAILKGWVDRVFAMGRFYNSDHLYETGIFKGKKAMLSLTTGGPPEHYIKDSFNGDINAILRPLHRGIFAFSGFTVLSPQVIYGPARKSANELTVELESWKQRLDYIFEEQPHFIGNY